MRGVRFPIVLALILGLAACGGRQKLTQPKGTGPVPTAYGAPAPATPDALMDLPTQAQPDRSAEPLRQSQERPDDPFDLPPES